MNHSQTALTTERMEFGDTEEALDLALTHWRCTRDTDGVEWWLLDQQGSDTNTLSQAVLQELKQLVDRVQQNTEIRAVVIRSAKVNGFIAGADISEFRGVTDVIKIEALLEEGHALLNQIENLSIPTIALLHGFCMGGGLELALACRYRIARNDTKLGFPEVNLGLHPGLGGTMRLPRQISPPEALQMMLTGKPIDAVKAKSLGLVDECAEERHFRNAVRLVSRQKISRRGQSFKTQWLNYKPANIAITHFSERKLREKVREDHYPAPYDLIELWGEHGSDAEAMLKAERHSFANLLSEAKTQNLIRVFFLREALKAQGKGEHKIRHVHLVGAGAMGGDIAIWSAMQGFTVTIEDRTAAQLAPTIQRAHALFNHKLHSSLARRDAMDRLIPDVSGQGRGVADLIIEAVPEKLDLKMQVLNELEKAKKPGAILASNTSSILLERLRETLQDPENFIGIHFFNPVAKMQLVEVVTHRHLSDATLARTTRFVKALKRLPIAVKSSPGFLVNRVLTPYLLEALALLDEGADKAAIDDAAEAFGLPMGPIELADFIGLDICLNVADTLHRELAQPLYKIPDWFRDKVKKGELGKKTGDGFYHYDDEGKPDKKTAMQDKVGTAVDHEIQDRLILSMLNTCVYCLQEGIVADAELLDGAIIFATGFAPFTGGPLHYARTKGIHNIVARLEALTEQYGERFTPASHWQSLIMQEETDARREYSAA